MLLANIDNHPFSNVQISNVTGGVIFDLEDEPCHEKLKENSGVKKKLVTNTYKCLIIFILFLHAYHILPLCYGNICYCIHMHTR